MYLTSLLGPAIDQGRRSRSLAGVVALTALLTFLAVRPSLAVSFHLYDVDFGQPHLAGYPPLEGAESMPSYLISQIVFGEPMVVETEGLLEDQPLRFDSSDGDGDQVEFDLQDMPSGDYYTYGSWVLVASAAADSEFRLIFDTPSARSIDFNADGTVDFRVPGDPVASSTYTVGVPVYVHVAIDLEHDYWTVSFDGTQVHEGGFGGASALDSIRATTQISNPEPCVAAIDDVNITVGRDEACNKLNFGDLTLGDSWVEGETVETEGVFVTVGPHYFTPGNCSGGTTSNQVSVVNNGSACGAGRELNLNNVSLDFDFGDPVREVVIPYGWYGGAIDLSVNGDCIVVGLPRDLNGINLGGVAITVWDFDNIPQGCGVIRLGGQVDQLSISGEEFFIDNVSYCFQCETDRRSAFEDQTVGTTFTVGDELSSGGATHSFHAYYPAGTSCTNPDETGIATIGNSGEACVDGKEIHLDGIADRIDFGEPVEWLVLSYGEGAGNVNIRVNDDCRNLTDLADVNGSVIGGVTVWAQDFGPAGQSCGQLYAVGPIDLFGIGGDELWIDNVRTCVQPVSGIEDAEGSAIGATRGNLDSFPNPFTDQTTLRFEAPTEGPVRLEVFDAAGRSVRTLVDGFVAAGSHVVDWDARNDEGSTVPSGIYWARVESGSTLSQHRMIVVK
ncbi:MAG: T9SS type A sorting domain-containing protein [Candidatus Eisenbacteria bacterium]|nr:T9SS type A sorting domain-containing protein [Candidatus Eisenbacteria bacterium]